MSWLQVRSSSAAISTVPGSSSVPRFLFSFLISFKMSLNASHFGLSSSTGSVDKTHPSLPYINHKHHNRALKLLYLFQHFWKCLNNDPTILTQRTKYYLFLHFSVCQLLAFFQDHRLFLWHAKRFEKDKNKKSEKNEKKTREKRSVKKDMFNFVQGHVQASSIECNLCQIITLHICSLIQGAWLFIV